jgi:cell pole-organizing protein PopZ
METEMPSGESVDAQLPATAPAEAPEPTSLVAPEAAAATTATVSTLLRTLAEQQALGVHRGGPTLEDIVREEIRPLLKAWLDHNLPPLVERVVSSEIQRLIGRAFP